MMRYSVLSLLVIAILCSDRVNLCYIPEIGRPALDGRKEVYLLHGMFAGQKHVRSVPEQESSSAGLLTLESRL